MDRLRGRLEREHRTLRCMAEIFCEHHHGMTGGALCDDCEALMQYAERRLEKCPYGAAKPTCANCPVHCYKPVQREAARDIMRFAGPRMPLRHPLRALTHLFDKLRRVQHPRALRGQRLEQARRGRKSARESGERSASGQPGH